MVLPMKRMLCPKRITAHSHSLWCLCSKSLSNRKSAWEPGGSPTKTQTSSQVTPGTAAGLMEAPLQRRRSPRGLRRITPGLVQRAATFQALTRQGRGQALLGLGKKLRKDMARWDGGDFLGRFLGCGVFFWGGWDGFWGMGLKLMWFKVQSLGKPREAKTWDGLGFERKVLCTAKTMLLDRWLIKNEQKSLFPKGFHIKGVRWPSK